MLLKSKNALVLKKGNETLMIEAWGKDSLRVRSTLSPVFIDRDWGLTEKINHGIAKITMKTDGAVIENGKISAKISNNGVISFFKDGKRVLHEYFHSYDPEATKRSCCTKVIAREYK